MTLQRSSLTRSLRSTSHRSSRDESAKNSKLVSQLKRTKDLLDLGSPSKTGSGSKVKRTKKIANLHGEFSSLAKRKSVTHEKGPACELDISGPNLGNSPQPPVVQTRLQCGFEQPMNPNPTLLPLLPHTDSKAQVSEHTISDEERIMEETRLQRERANRERLRDLAARLLGRPRTVFESGGPDRS